MINSLLAFGVVGAWELLVILIILAIPIGVAIIFILLMLRNKKENIRLRLDVGKLADELEQTRKQKGMEGSDNSSQSG